MTKKRIKIFNKFINSVVYKLKKNEKKSYSKIKNKKNKNNIKLNN